MVVSAVRRFLPQISLANERLARYGVRREELRTRAEKSVSAMGDCAR
jgi:hypothetical protein